MFSGNSGPQNALRAKFGNNNNQLLRYKNSPLTHTTSFKTDNISYFKSTYHTFHISTWVSFLILVFVLIMAENNDDKLEVIGEETMTSIRDQHYNVVPKSEHKIEAQVRLRMY